jgi:flagellar hook-associated protein 1 FlgK
VAYNAARQINDVHRAGEGLDAGNLGPKNFFDLPGGAFAGGTAVVENAASLIQIGADIAANAQNIAVGMATAGPGPALEGDNRNALALASLRGARQALWAAGGAPTTGPADGPTATVIEHHVSFVANVGQQTQTMQNALLQHERISESLEQRREETAGVSLDEESINLIRLQRAFQANARMISVLEGMLDEVINLI